MKTMEYYGMMAACAFVCCGVAAAAESSAGPSIEQMFTVIEAELAKKSTSTGKVASKSKKPERRRTWPGASKLKPPSEAIEEVLDDLSEDVRRRLVQAARDRLPWQSGKLLFRIEDFKKAAAVWGKMQKSRISGYSKRQGGSNYDRYAQIDMEYMRALMYIGNKKMAEVVYLDAIKRIERAEGDRNPMRRPPAYIRQNLDRVREFMDQHIEARHQEKDLRDALEKNPNGNQQWELVSLLEPGRRQAELPLRWLLALLEMSEKYPDHGQVKSGNASQQTVRAYRYHQMYDEAIELLESMTDSYPKHQYVSGGSADWDLAETFMSKARDEDRRGDREAIETYRDAISAFGDYRKKHPKSGHLKPRNFNGRQLPPMLSERIQQANNAINQIKNRRR